MTAADNVKEIDPNSAPALRLEISALAAELATARNAIEALGRQLREARERADRRLIVIDRARNRLGNFYPGDWPKPLEEWINSAWKILDDELTGAALKGAGA